MARVKISGRTKRMRLHFPLVDEGTKDRLQALEDRLQAEGYAFDTGYSLSPPVREWELDESYTGPTSKEELIRRVRFQGIEFAVSVVREERKKKRVAYKVGDIVRIPLHGTKMSGYGRILRTEDGYFLLELFKIASKTAPPLKDLTNREWLFRIFCDDSGITRAKTWRIIGNQPVGEVKLPLFWDKSVTDGQLYLHEHWLNLEPRRPTTPAEIRNLKAQPTGISGYQYVEDLLLNELRGEGVNPSDPRN